MPREDFFDKLEDFDFDSFGKDDNYDNSDVYQVIQFFANKIYYDFEKQLLKKDCEIAKLEAMLGVMEKEVAKLHPDDCNCMICEGVNGG